MLLFIFHKKYRSSRRDHIWILSVSLYTAHTHAHTSIHTLKSLVNFCSRDFLFNEKFDDSTLAKRHIVGHFVRSDTGHVMQAIDVTWHSWITQQLVPSTTVLSFVCRSRFACKNKLLMTFGTTLVLHRKDILNFGAYVFGIASPHGRFFLEKFPEVLIGYEDGL